MENVRIQDDLYHYVNGEWIENAVIPDDRPVTGGFTDLSDGVEKTLTQDLKTMNEKDEYPDEYMRRAGKFFALVMDTKRRSSEGFRPVMPLLKKIRGLTGITHFNRNLKDLVMDGIPLPFDLSVQEDMKDSNARCLYVGGPSTILPDTTYYADAMAPQRDALLGVWKNMAAGVMKYARIPEEEKALYIEDTLKFDAIIAGLVKSREERSEYTKMYNPTKTVRVGTLLRPVKFKRLLSQLFETVPEWVSVADPRFLKGFSTLFNEENFPLYKHWAYVNCAISAAPYLSEKLREIGTSYRRALTGVASVSTVERYAYSLTATVFSDALGLYYGRTYFGEEAKRDILEMVHEIIAEYKKRVMVNPILGEETRLKAIRKLDTMKVKMGYPDKLNAIADKLVYEEGLSLFGALSALEKIRREDEFGKLFQPVDKTEWVMNAHIVNACYNPFSNDITFPAAILQAPFYSVKQTRSCNLGGIGAVIGHEISHAFDNNGAKIDENGVLSQWWTKEDFKRFDKATKAMIKQFEGITLPFGEVNATLTVSENISDNGGMAVTLAIMKGMDAPDYKEYFINWARVWCAKARPEYSAMLLKVDVHGPKELRGNMPPRNFSEWYETFGVTKNDKMYIAPNKRLIIW